MFPASDEDHQISDDTAVSSQSRNRLAGRVLGIVAAIVAGLLVVLVVGPRVLGAATPHFYAGTVLQQTTAAPSLDSLTFADGSPVDLTAFEGEVVMLYFGYTSCPDVCPTTLIDARNAVNQLDEAEAERVRLLMVSVDPERDTPAVVQNYAESFHPSFLGASGTSADVLNAATRYGIFYPGPGACRSQRTRPLLRRPHVDTHGG